MAEGRTKYPVAVDDWYVENEAVTHFLLDREAFEGPIWDPACGQCNILSACHERELAVTGSDIVDRRPPHRQYAWEQIDFSALTVGVWDGDIICNPPYGRAKLAETFIRNALAVATGKVAMLVNAKFLFSDGRGNGLWRFHPPSAVYPIYPRPSIPPGLFLQAGGKAKGGVENFVWVVWNADRQGEGKIRWI